MESPVFEATLNTIHSFLVPLEIAQPFLDLGHDRVRVRVLFEDTEVHYYGALKPIKGVYPIMLNKSNQKKLGVLPNDYFKVQLLEDTSKYGVDLPEEFEAVMESDPEALKIFDSLSIGKKRGLIYVILRYKNSQTRIDKSLLLCQNLKMGIRDPKELFRRF